MLGGEGVGGQLGRRQTLLCTLYMETLWTDLTEETSKETNEGADPKINGHHKNNPCKQKENNKYALIKKKTKFSSYIRKFR